MTDPPGRRSPAPRVTTSDATAVQLGAVVAAAADVLGADGVGAMLLDDGGALRLIGASDDLARHVEAVQIALGDGPGIETLRTGRDVAVDDLAAIRRWGDVAERLVALGAGAVLSSAIRVDDEVVGNFNTIWRQAHPWSSGEVRASRAYAQVIGALLEVTASDPTGWRAHRSGAG